MGVQGGFLARQTWGLLSPNLPLEITPLLFIRHLMRVNGKRRAFGQNSECHHSGPLLKRALIKL
jgi:hypothetical protein